MSRIDELIAELCPNGVEYKKLGEVATISRGGSFQKKDFCEDGVPCIHYGQIYTRYGLFADKTLTFISEDAAKKQKYAVKNDIVMAVTSENIDDVCKCVAWLGDDEIAVSGHTAIIHHTLNPKYLCYYFHTAMFYAQKKKLAHGTKVIEVTPDKLADITIPVPPLEVQSEIVKALDNFTELTARKKQYEYYRDLLLDFGVHGGGTSECEWRTLGTVIISLKTGLNPRQNFSLNENGSNLPYITGKDIYDNAINVTERTDRITTDALALINKRANLESGLLLFASTGTGTVGRMAIIQEYNNDWGISETLYVIKVNENIILTSFLLHYLYSASAKSQFEPKISKGSVPHLKVKDLENVKVPIISLEEQTRIVSILDRFDKLCNDISEGLPAEIEARQKQYEYYRDKMLSFNEA